MDVTAAAMDEATAAAAAALVVAVPPAAVAYIGPFGGSLSASAQAGLAAGFRASMERAGWVEGRTGWRAPPP